MPSVRSIRDLADLRSVATMCWCSNRPEFSGFLSGCRRPRRIRPRGSPLSSSRSAFLPPCVTASCITPARSHSFPATAPRSSWFPTSTHRSCPGAGSPSTISPPHWRSGSARGCILSLDTACLKLVRDHPLLDSDLEVIHPRNAREQFGDGMRSEIDAIAARPEGFRHRHPRLWLTISLVAILGLAGFAAAGLAAGRMTAILPGIVCLVWTASLFIDRAAARAKARVPDDLPDGLDG